MTDYADLVRLRLRYEALVEKYDEIRDDPEIQYQFATAKRNLALLFAKVDRLRRLEEAIAATRDDHAQLT